MPLVLFTLTSWLFVHAPGPVGARPGLAASVDASAPAAGDVSPGASSGLPDAGAPQPRVDPPRANRLAYRPRLDVPMAVVAAGAWIVAEADKTHLAAARCKWCDLAPDGSNSLNGFDSWGRRALRWHNSGRAIALSNITAFGLAPAAAYGLQWMAAKHDDREAEAPADLILMAQSMAIASDVTEIMKFTIGRQRPFVHALAPGALATTPASADNNTSFPSGHTTLAFSLAMSGWEIATLRGYSNAPRLLQAGLPLAVLTAYFRVAADRHYLTDVLAAAGVGSAVGIAVPYLAHRRTASSRVPTLRIVPAGAGEMLAAQWSW